MNNLACYILLSTFIWCFSSGFETFTTPCINTTIASFPANVRVKTDPENRICQFAVQTNNHVSVIVTPFFDDELTSYMFIDNKNWEYDGCQNKQYNAFTMTRQHCISHFSDRNIEFYFVNADVDIYFDITANVTCKVNNDMAIQTRNTASISKCIMTEYDKVAFGAPLMDDFGDIVGISYSDSLRCSLQCHCELGNKEWIETCIGGTTTISLIIYPDDNEGISLEDTGLIDISSSAFSSLSQLTLLYLNRNYFRSLPDDIFKPLPVLHHLDLSENSLSVLAPGLFDSLVSLGLLNLSFNVLHQLYDDTFNTQYELVVLDLQSNKLTQLHPDVFNSLHSLRLLLLVSNFLTTLPPKVLYLCKNLERIDLNFNQISHVYKGMFDIEHLKRDFDYIRNRWDVYLLIDLSNNKLVSIDEDAFLNANVSQLLMHNNPLMNIPPRVFHPLFMLRQIGMRNTSIGILPEGLLDFQTDLEHLDLGYNYLASLPQGIFDNLFYLMTLKLDNNRLTNLHSTIFMSLRNLTVLDLGFNRLTRLPNSVLSLFNLQILDLVNNDLIELDMQIFSNCQNLDVIRIDMNNLSIVPQSLFNSSYLMKTLFLSKNRIETLHPGFFDATVDLENLELSYNSLRNMPNYIFLPLKMLQYLNLSHNHMLTVPSFATLSMLRILDIRNNELTSFVSHTFIGLERLEYLSISSNFVMSIPDGIFNDLGSLVFLDMSNNLFQHLQSGLFLSQNKLVTLILARNMLRKIPHGAFLGLQSLLRIDLDYNRISYLEEKTFHGLSRTTFLNLSRNHLTTLDAGVLDFSYRLETIDLRNNTLYLVQKESFIGAETAKILVDEFATCCYINEDNCVSRNPRPAYLTCKRMLPELTLRVSMWCLGVSAVLCNLFAFYTRRNGDMFVQNILISHLAISDFLMGINMIFIASSDLYFGNFFPSYSNRWRLGIPCKIAGVLSILSSEASVFFITLISVDRFLGVKYPFNARRLSLQSAQKCAYVVWLGILTLSVVPLILSSFVRDVFEVSEVCVGIPMVKRPITTIETDYVELAITEFRANIDYSSNYVYFIKGVELENENITENITFPISTTTSYELATYFSLVVFIGLNLFCFLVVPFCYIQILLAVKKTAKAARRNQTLETELRMTVKSLALVFTDFCCWVPLATVCVLVQSGVITVSPEVYAWTVAFILPINSSINPFMYTLASSISDRLSRTRKYYEESEFRKSHTGLSSTSMPRGSFNSSPRPSSMFAVGDSKV